MRLTLRTLLAYMDGILEPADHEELAKRVEASEFAGDLVHRTRDTMRRLRLGAPAVDAEVHDANLVAEYLDNILTPEQVAEFERRCLESDPELAEVASCHHILTMVLGQRAQVDAEVRQAAYALPQGLADAHAAATADQAAVSVAAVATPADVDASPTEVPDYLRASNRSLASRLAPAIAALLVLGATSYLAFRPGGWLNPQQVALNNAAATPTAEPPTGDTPVVPPAPVEPAMPEPAMPEQAPGELPVGEELPIEQPTNEAPAETPAETLAEPEVPMPELPATEATSDNLAPEAAAPEVPAPETPSPEASETATADAGPIAPEMPLPPEGRSPEVASSEATPSEAGESEGPMEVDPQALEEALAESEGGATPGDTDAATPAIAPEPAGPVVVGRLEVSSAREALLVYDEATKGWLRLPPLSEIKAGQRLLALPTYRPTLGLASGVSIELVDATLIEIDEGETRPGAAVASPRVKLIYGQLLATNTGSNSADFEVSVGDLHGMAKLSRGAAIAIEADRPFQPGIDPEEALAPMQADFYAPIGNVSWTSNLGDISADRRGMWRLAGDSLSPLDAYGDGAAWIENLQPTLLQREAKGDVERKLKPDEPIWSQLAEIATSRRREEVALAAICSVHVGFFDPFVAALNDANQKSAWEEEIETLRQAMSRSPKLAEGVRESLERIRESHAPALYEMLRGYTLQEIGQTKEERQNGAIKKLIDWLESDQIDCRVLASHNLEQITGRRGVFNPVGPERTRELAIARYRMRLKDGDLGPKLAQ